jgi:hypothetical protein
LAKQPDNIFLVDQTVRTLVKKMSGTRHHNPSDFAELIDRLLKVTVLQQGHSISYIPISKNSGTVCSRKGEALPLNNGKFLKLVMDYGPDSSSNQDSKLQYACVQYQFDHVRHSNKFIFRYDFDIDPEADHPVSHLQIRGQLAEKPVKKPLEEIRFPLVKVTIESILKLLVNDFGIVPNNPNWRHTLKFSEDAFLAQNK